MLQLTNMFRDTFPNLCTYIGAGKVEEVRAAVPQSTHIHRGRQGGGGASSGGGHRPTASPLSPPASFPLSSLPSLASTRVASPNPRTVASPNPRTYIGAGKVEEVRAAVAGMGVETVVFDDELSAGQLRNLEKEFGGDVRVCDRTALIIDIFSQRANTKEATLQVQLAQLEYQLPRLTRMWTHLERQAGGMVKGMGEKQIEVDKRIIRERRAGESMEGRGGRETGEIWAEGLRQVEGKGKLDGGDTTWSVFCSLLLLPLLFPRSLFQPLAPTPPLPTPLPALSLLADSSSLAASSSLPLTHSPLLSLHLRPKVAALRRSLTSLREHRQQHRNRRAGLPIPVLSLVGYTNQPSLPLLPLLLLPASPLQMAALRRSLTSVREHRQQHRDRRAGLPIPVLSLVGYTNAGKSTLLNRLTGAGVLAEDKLFATLDPTTRRTQVVCYPRPHHSLHTGGLGAAHSPHTLAHSGLPIQVLSLVGPTHCTARPYAAPPAHTLHRSLTRCTARSHAAPPAHTLHRPLTRCTALSYAAPPAADADADAE
ncbi:unnamed protein product [Closterium sp. NIES-53]